MCLVFPDGALTLRRLVELSERVLEKNFISMF